MRNSYGYVKVKIEEPNVWKRKHILEWEKYNREIPKGSYIIFLDNNKMNTDISNLEIVTRSENLILNRKNLRFDDRELTKQAVSLVKLTDKINKLKNGG